MELSDRALLYFTISIPLSIMYDGWIAIILLWLHFAWCVSDQKKKWKEQDRRIEQMRRERPFDPILNPQKSNDYVYDPEADRKCREEAFEKVLEEAIKRMHERENSEEK